MASPIYLAQKSTEMRDKSPESTAVGAGRSAVASRWWLNFLRWTAFVHLGNMVERKPTSYRSLIRIGLVVCASGAFIAFLISFWTPGPIVFQMGTNGKPRFCGVSLANTNLQKIAFGTVAAFGGKATMAVPNSWFSTTNKTQLTNVENTFNDMKRAGISFPYGLTLKTIPTP